jgi:AAA ATPase domain
VPGTGVVGRDREMAAVAALLDAVPSGPCGLLLEGAAGIGKTTVWRAGAAWAAERSCTVLSCRPAESEATLSFAALGDLLEGVVGRALAGLPAPQRRALEVALLLATRLRPRSQTPATARRHPEPAARPHRTGIFTQLRAPPWAKKGRLSLLGGGSSSVQPGVAARTASGVLLVRSSGGQVLCGCLCG